MNREYDNVSILPKKQLYGMVFEGMPEIIRLL